MFCKNCGKEITAENKFCPACGVKFENNSQVEQKQKTIRPAVVVISIIIGICCYFAIMCIFPYGIFQDGIFSDVFGGIVQNEQNNIERKVANDAVEQYNIAKRQGDRIQICVQAGFVSAAYLQAKDQENYNRWKSIEKSDCRAAGMPQY